MLRLSCPSRAATAALTLSALSAARLTSDASFIDPANAARGGRGTPERADADRLAAEQRAEQRRAHRHGGLQLLDRTPAAVPLDGRLGPPQALGQGGLPAAYSPAHRVDRLVARRAARCCSLLRKSRSDSPAFEVTPSVGCREQLDALVLRQPPCERLLPGAVFLRLRCGGGSGAKSRIGGPARVADRQASHRAVSRRPNRLAIAASVTGRRKEDLAARRSQRTIGNRRAPRQGSRA